MASFTGKASSFLDPPNTKSFVSSLFPLNHSKRGASILKRKAELVRDPTFCVQEPSAARLLCPPQKRYLEPPAFHEEDCYYNPLGYPFVIYNPHNWVPTI